MHHPAGGRAGGRVLEAAGLGAAARVEDGAARARQRQVPQAARRTLMREGTAERPAARTTPEGERAARREALLHMLAMARRRRERPVR